MWPDGNQIQYCCRDYGGASSSLMDVFCPKTMPVASKPDNHRTNVTNAKFGPNKGGIMSMLWHPLTQFTVKDSIYLNNVVILTAGGIGGANSFPG
jgi:hypothetical protein